MNQLGQVYVTHPKRIAIGSLAYNERAGNVLMGIDLAALLPLCRETEQEELCAYCNPRVEIEAPYIQADIALDLKTKRIVLGWVCTSDDAVGSVKYAVRLNVGVILKRYDCVFVHLSPNNVKEEE